MSVRLRMTLKPSKSVHESARSIAATAIEKIFVGRSRAERGDDPFVVLSVEEYHLCTTHDEAGSASLLLNDLLHRLRYLFDNPDATLSITPDGPRLNVASDGLDHEVMFKLARDRA